MTFCIYKRPPPTYGWDLGVSGEKTQHKAGQRLWTSGPAVRRSSEEGSYVTGFGKQLENITQIRRWVGEGRGGENVFFYLAFAKITAFSKYHITH